MTYIRWWRTIGWVWLVVWLLPVGVAGAPTVRQIRYAVHDGETRVVIDLSKRASYKVLAVEGPARIAINLPDVRSAQELRAFTIASGVVRRVRINRLSWGSQVVLDLRGRATWSDLYLSAVDGMPNRIVLDVQPETPAPRAESARRKTTEKVATRRKPTRDRMVIAIDAGHGGSDPGAIGRYKLVEKREALAIARRVVAAINAQPGFKAVLTRDSDIFLSLPSRTRIAQQKKADIFVSIHLNSAPRRSARGAEVFFLSPAGAQSTASRLLKNKNKAAKELGVLGSNSEDILHMLVDVNQQSMMQRSSVLAEEILRSMKRPGLPPTRSVKQRSFAVLKSITMPSVMVEVGFVTNTQDAKLIKSDGGKTKISNAIANGVINFMKKYPPPSEDTRRYLVHRVKKGDTLWNISKRYNTSVASIQQFNRMGKSKLIRVGQELVIRDGNGTY